MKSSMMLGMHPEHLLSTPTGVPESVSKCVFFTYLDSVTWISNIDIPATFINIPGSILLLFWYGRSFSLDRLFALFVFIFLDCLVSYPCTFGLFFDSISSYVGLTLGHFLLFLRSSTYDWIATIFSSLSDCAFHLLVSFIILNFCTYRCIRFSGKILIPSSYPSCLNLTYLMNNLSLHMAYPFIDLLGDNLWSLPFHCNIPIKTWRFHWICRCHVHILPWNHQWCLTGYWFGKLSYLSPSGTPWYLLWAGGFLICGVWWGTPLTINSPWLLLLLILTSWFTYTYTSFVGVLM